MVEQASRLLKPARGRFYRGFSGQTITWQAEAMMEAAAWWELLLGGAVALLMILWFRPGIKAALERGKTAKKDWPAVLIPIGLVVLFVLLLIQIVRS
jgi:hypothetical protein